MPTKKTPQKKQPAKKASPKKASTKKASTKADVDRWFATECPPAFRATLSALRAEIAGLAPGATECISYGLPSFRYADHGLVAYGVGKTHCSFYPMSSTALSGVKDALTGFFVSAGTVRFTPERPLPPGLVATLVKLRMKENEAAQARRR